MRSAFVVLATIGLGMGLPAVAAGEPVWLDCQVQWSNTGGLEGFKDFAEDDVYVWDAAKSSLAGYDLKAKTLRNINGVQVDQKIISWQGDAATASHYQIDRDNLAMNGAFYPEHHTSAVTDHNGRAITGAGQCEITEPKPVVKSGKRI
jgi:hypothetical protein